MQLVAYGALYYNYDTNNTEHKTQFPFYVLCVTIYIVIIDIMPSHINLVDNTQDSFLGS